MDGTTYREYRRKLSAPDLTCEELEAILDDAAENPLISTAQFESLWFVVVMLRGDVL